MLFRQDAVRSYFNRTFHEMLSLSSDDDGTKLSIDRQRRDTIRYWTALANPVVDVEGLLRLREHHSKSSKLSGSRADDALSNARRIVLFLHMRGTYDENSLGLCP